MYLALIFCSFILNLENCLVCRVETLETLPLRSKQVGAVLGAEAVGLTWQVRFGKEESVSQKAGAVHIFDS